MPVCVYAIATMDTKGAELAYVAQCLRQAGAVVQVKGKKQVIVQSPSSGAGVPARLESDCGGTEAPTTERLQK